VVLGGVVFLVFRLDHGGFAFVFLGGGVFCGGRVSVLGGVFSWVYVVEGGFFFEVGLWNSFLDGWRVEWGGLGSFRGGGVGVGGGGRFVFLWGVLAGPFFWGGFYLKKGAGDCGGWLGGIFGVELGFFAVFWGGICGVVDFLLGDDLWEEGGLLERGGFAKGFLRGLL